MNKKIKMILSIALIMIILGIQISYAISYVNQDSGFLTVNSEKISQNETLEIVFDLNKVEYKKFKVVLSSNIDNGEIQSNSNITLKEENNAIIIEIDKDKLSINKINLSYVIPEETAVNSKIQLSAKVFVKEEKETTETEGNTTTGKQEKNILEERKTILVVEKVADGNSGNGGNTLEQGQNVDANQNTNANPNDATNQNTDTNQNGNANQNLAQNSNQNSAINDNQNSNQNASGNQNTNINPNAGQNQSGTNANTQSGTNNGKSNTPNMPTNGNANTTNMSANSSNNASNLPISSSKSGDISNIAKSSNFSTSTVLQSNGNSGAQVSTNVETAKYNGSNNNYLKNLKVKGVELNTQFNKENTTYFVKVTDISKLEITATVEDSSAKVSITGNDSIKKGTNKILIAVTADNGQVRYYRIFVTGL